MDTKMKRALYFLAGIALLASCNVESLDEPQSEAAKVPLNITVQTKAGGSGDGGSAQDIKSIRVVVFTNTGDPSTDLVKLNEYYSFGFGVDNKDDHRYTVTVKPTLELDLNTNSYYVYAILNEDGYTLTDSQVLSNALDDVANRSGMNTLLQTKATYPTDGVKVAPYCLMSACKTVDFSAGRDLPIEVHFGMYEADATNPSPIDRTMAQITVESIKSNANATNAAELSKVFVLDVDLVNVPSGIAWGVDASGNLLDGSTTGGKTSLPIGAAFDPEDGTTPYYRRIWDGNVYKQVDVNVNCEQRTTANYYRTDASSKSGWAFYDDSEGVTPITKYVYAGTKTLPTGAPPKPYGFPTLNAKGDKYVYWIWNQDDKKPQNCKNVKTEKKKDQYTQAYNEYIGSLPHDPATGQPVSATDAAAYNTYYTTNKTAVDAYYAELPTVLASAITGLATIDKHRNDPNNPNNSVRKLLNTDLPAIFAKETYYATNKYTIASVKSDQPTTYVSYCTGEPWTVNLGDSYYVPENISATYDQNTTTCIKVTLAVADPNIVLSSTADVTKLPVPENIQDDAATYTYLFDNYYYASAADYAIGKLTKQVTTGANSDPTGAFNLTQTTDQPKIKVTQFDANGWKNVTDEKFTVVDLFKQNGRVVDADDETVPADSTTNNRFVVYIPGENFWRTGTGLTGTVTVDAEQEGATFSWNIPAADNTATTDFDEVKVFYIPVNNKQFNSDYSVRRNTKYTVKLTVGDNTYAGFTKASGPEDAANGVAGLSITADVTAETLIEDEN